MIMNRYFIRIVCILMVSGLFWGCSGSAKNSSEGQPEEELSEGTNMGRDKTEKDFLEKTESDKIPNKGDEAEATKDNKNNRGEKVNDQTTDITYELLDHYKEKSIPSVYTQDNENESYCNVLLNQDNEIEYYTVAREDDGYYIWKYTLWVGVTKEEADRNPNLWVYERGAAWEREPVLWLEGIKAEIDQGRVFFVRGEDQNEYAWYMGNEEKAHLMKRIGDSCIEIPISNWRITEQAVVAVLENGIIVSADAGRECFLYNPENGELLISFQSGWYESICVKGNIIYISAPGGNSVQRYDADKMEFLPMIEAGFDNSVRIALEKDNVYVCTPTGIFLAKEGDTSFQKIMEAGTFHFARETGVLLKFFVVGDTFFIVYGEDGVSIKEYSPEGEEEKRMDSFVVYSLRRNDIILDLISEFQNQYPEIELIYETGEGAEGAVTVSDHIRALNTGILAGDGPDVLLLDGLPAEFYKEKGILEDLIPKLGSVRENLLPNILEAYITEDKLYMLPMRIKIPMFMTSGQQPEVYSSLEALVEYSEQVGGVGNMRYSYLDFLQIFYYNYMPDIGLEDGIIKREAIRESLSLVKRFCESEQVTEKQVWGTSYLQGRNIDGYFAKGEADFAFLNMNGGYELGSYPASVRARGGELVSNGTKFFPNALLGINKLSGKDELTQLFIEFAFSYQIQSRYVPLSGYSIDRNTLDKFAKMDLSYMQSGDDKIALQWFTAEESARMIKIVEEAVIPVTVEENVWEIISDIAEDYLEGTKGLDESVDGIVNRLQLYLYEL